MKFSQLRLSGFKSFVEPTELLIKDGLTGIVGPNGCGKSNLVEALRWVMGETSAKNMRGGSMDDVIFAGTTNRPARNMAEVTLGLDNTERAAPAAYNESSEIDITRRIRRDTGSDYRINGKITRARDVQLLFADMATGAHSTAIVSQGRVGSLINAQPKDRRHLLEEAAGISGLHSRRHEAELRLRAADSNLERVDDVSGQLEGQLTNLKRQVRQATRYRNISGHIRKAEAMLYYRKYELASATEMAAKVKLREAVEAVTELTRRTAQAQTASLTANEALKPLRGTETAAAALVHKLALQNEQLIAEEERLKRAQKQLEDRKIQISSDIQREKTLEKDAADAVQTLREEKIKLQQSVEDESPRLKKLRADIQHKQSIIKDLQTNLDTSTEEFASKKARLNSLKQQLENFTKNHSRQTERFERLNTEKHILQGQLQALEKSNDVYTELGKSKIQLENLTSKLEAMDVKRQHADKTERAARQDFANAEKKISILLAEIKTLNSVLQRGEARTMAPVFESLKVKAGYEIALGAALGEDLDASIDTAAPTYWSEFTPINDQPQFPKGVKTLNDFVKGEAALKTRLSQIGVISGHEEAEKICDTLCYGQRLVSLEGDLWRWDGYRQKAGNKSAAAVRLEQRNRLQVLELEQESAATALKKLKAVSIEAEKLRSATQINEKTLRVQRREAEQILTTLREKEAEQQRTEASKRSRLESLTEQIENLATEIEEISNQVSDVETELTESADLTVSQIKNDTLKIQLREGREDIGSVRAERDHLSRESAIRRDRLITIESERESWIKRSSKMAEHFSQLEIRFSSTDQDLQELANKPNELRLKRGQLADEMARAEGSRAATRDHVSEAEHVLMQCDTALRQTQDALGTCREERVRHQADVEHSAEALQNLSAQIYEKLECPPAHIKDAGQIHEDEEIPPIDISERKVDRLRKEREGMGPVNLRAEIEANEVAEQLSTLLKERADLEAAIARLRQGISNLNKEGRERLLTAFKKVDTHFQELFRQVFGGGFAHLKLTESEDPLAAGLEIMASPPGKKLQLMSLLSGGEQALTAVALLFAVFLTNPAPICVLDEVDAPLDDVNVDRLCNLLDQLSADSATRFLIVTHHPITMARMDRLFGVTMAERGISQLVSVDLTRAQLMTNETS